MKTGIINLIICFFIALILSPFLIKFLRKIKFGQSILEYVEKHKTKSGTPTMGGIIFIIAGIMGYFIFYGKNNSLATVSILSFLFFGVLGFLDDFIKIKFKQNEGLKPYQKIIGQLGISIIIAIFVYMSDLVGSKMYLPFVDKTIDIGFWIIPFVIIFYLAVVNSVNLIDGLDGLCGGVSTIVILALTIIISLNTQITGVHLDEMNMLVTISFGVVGAILGFLCFNCFPAKVFMGDTGSLAIGGFLASLACLSKQYFLVVIIGFAYVLTSVSVIMQVLYYKATKKRIFKMAPLHHHFEQDFHENKVVWNYIIFTLILGLLAIIFYI